MRHGTSLRFAIVGCGYITQAEHVPALLEAMPAIRVVAAVDHAIDRAAALGAVFGAPSFATLKEALAATSFDAVLIATPGPTHAVLIQEAAAAGLHILVEKPLAYSRADARAAIDAVRRAGVTCMVGYHRRHDDDCLAARRLLAEGAIGKPARRSASAGLPSPASFEHTRRRRSSPRRPIRGRTWRMTG